MLRRFRIVAGVVALVVAALVAFPTVAVAFEVDCLSTGWWVDLTGAGFYLTSVDRDSRNDRLWYSTDSYSWVSAHSSYKSVSSAFIPYEGTNAYQAIRLNGADARVYSTYVPGFAAAGGSVPEPLDVNVVGGSLEASVTTMPPVSVTTSATLAVALPATQTVSISEFGWVDSDGIALWVLLSSLGGGAALGLALASTGAREHRQEGDRG